MPRAFIHPRRRILTFLPQRGPIRPELRTDLTMTCYPVICTVAAAIALAGCGKSEEAVEPAPVAQLQGPWHMINRHETCDSYYTVISPLGFYRLYDGGKRKKYFAIRKFTLEPGKVTLLTKGLSGDPEQELNLVFSLADGQLRLLDIIGAKGASYKEPPNTLEPNAQASMKAQYRLNEQRFAMNKCAGA